ncbi:MAG: DNA-binding protein WhiA [Eubacteriaceae bacterium]|nr:DNA-binding protein WhiA [Eubacteriaceae bacterium]
MSFSANIKEEVINKFPDDPEQQEGALYALLLTGASYVFKGRGMFSCRMDFPMAAGASFAFKLIKALYSHSCELSVITRKAFGEKRIYRCELKGEAAKIVLHNNSLISPEGVVRIHPAPDRGFLPSEQALKGFIKGAFLACGLIYEPSRAYEAQFRLKSEPIAEGLRELLGELGIASKIRPLKNDIIVYIKTASGVMDLMAVMEAASGVFKLTDTRIYKETIARTVREGNLFEANLDKTVEASLRQREAIDSLTKSGKLRHLSEELINAARLRSEYPEESLADLAARAKVSRSTFAKRLERLITISRENKSR